ncbi:hypothetical protein ACLOJK_010984, partial [Asimina triloba]
SRTQTPCDLRIESIGFRSLSLFWIRLATFVGLETDVFRRWTSPARPNFMFVCFGALPSLQQQLQLQRELEARRGEGSHSYQPLQSVGSMQGLQVPPTKRRRHGKCMPQRAFAMLPKAMEAFAKLQRKWKQSPQQALLLFAFVIIVVVGLCATAVSRKRRAHAKQQRVQQLPTGEEVDVDVGGVQGKSGWGEVKRALRGSACWSERRRSNLDGMPALLAGVANEVVNWSGRSSPISPLWQRRILMGERCELPRFSGLILYDERGRPLRQKDGQQQQEKTATPVSCMLLLPFHDQTLSIHTAGMSHMQWKTSSWCDHAQGPTVISLKHFGILNVNWIFALEMFWSSDKYAYALPQDDAWILNRTELLWR